MNPVKTANSSKIFFLFAFLLCVSFGKAQMVTGVWHGKINGQKAEVKIIKSGDSIPVQVTNPVPVYFTYISAWSTGQDVVQFRDDIYGRDGVDELQITSSL